MTTRIGKVLSTERTDSGVDVKVDMGGGDIVTAEHFAPPGEDSLPMVGDDALVEEADGAGARTVVGYDDPENEGVAAEGERRIYSRQADGTPAVEYWLKANGDAVIKGHVAAGTLLLDWPGVVIVKSPDIRVGDETASRPIACVGDFVAGSFQALCTAPGSPIVPVPPMIPTASGGVPFVGQIISGYSGAKCK
jgi:hypothetical protein